MKVNGKLMSVVAKDMSDIRMAINTKEISLMAKLMVKEFINGAMVKFMMANGRMVSKRDTVFGKGYLEILTLENGRIVKQMGMESINGKMVIDMKENGGIV